MKFKLVEERPGGNPCQKTLTLKGDGYYGSFTYVTTMNCKLQLLEQVGCTLEMNPKESWKSIMDQLLQHGEIVVACNVIKKDIADFIKSNYKLYSYSEIPVGYTYNPIQYHMIIKNELSNSDRKQYFQGDNAVLKL